MSYLNELSILLLLCFIYTDVKQLMHILDTIDRPRSLTDLVPCLIRCTPSRILNLGSSVLL